MNFTDRKTSIAQKIQDDWRKIALNEAERVRKLFHSNCVKRILNVKFHEVSKTL